MHQLNFPLCHQPRACDFSSHPNQNFSRRGCGGVIKGERSVALAEMQAEGKENLRGRWSNDWKWVAFSPRSYLKQLFAYNSVIPKKHSWEGWYGNPYISLPWYLLNPIYPVYKLGRCFGCWSGKNSSFKSGFFFSLPSIASNNNFLYFFLIGIDILCKVLRSFKNKVHSPSCTD